jgi:hypothetical protein
MWTWALTKYVRDASGNLRAVAESYGNGLISPRWPDGLNNPEVDENGQVVGEIWGLVTVRLMHVEAAAQDPRVQPYHTVYDTITPETVTAYQEQGAQPGMMLCQLLSLLARWEAGFRHATAL